MKSIVVIALTCVSMFSTPSFFAQKGRFDFAQTYIGLQSDYLPSYATTGSDLFVPRILIGGSHFWYRADFYISFPVATFSSSAMDGQFSEGVITGARYLPFGPGKKLPYPFFGVQWMTPSFQRGEGPTIQKNRLGLEFGLSLVFKKRNTLELRAQHMRNSVWEYPLNRIEMESVALPNLNIALSFKRYFDMTAGNASAPAIKWRERAYEVFEEQGALSTWSIAVGWSANVQLTDSDFESDASYFPSKPAISSFPDIALGYYLNKPDVAFRLTWRPLTTKQEAFQHSWRLNEHRFSAEAVKFIGDYHGFVPFMGLAGGATRQHFHESDSDIIINDFTRWQPSFGVVFGWDIRPTNVDWFILRTNLRWLPPIDQSKSQLAIDPHHLEVNFIQLVFYPKRIKNLKNIDL